MYKISHTILNQPNVLLSTDNEYLFAEFLLKNMYYNNTNPYILIEVNGVLLKQEESNSLIERNFPVETDMIKKDMMLEKTLFGKYLIKFGVVSDWSFNYFKNMKVKNESNKKSFNR